MKEIIEAVHANKAAFAEPVQPPATRIAIDSAVAEAKARFGAAVPGDFQDFLTIANGIGFDGVVIYGADQTPERTGPADFWHGLIAANLAWRDGSDRGPILILGETDMDLFTVDLAGENPLVQDKVSDDVIRRFDSVAQGIAALLKARL